VLNESGFIIAKHERKTNLIAAAVRSALNAVVVMTDDELLSIPAGTKFVFDTECYSNFWFIAFKCLDNGKFVTFENSPDCSINTTKLNWMLWRFCIIGFNSNNYDLPMMALALTGVSCATLKEASDFIIKSGPQYGTKKVTQFDFEREYKVKIQQYDHIDLFNVCPVNGGLTATPASLKLYAGRLHAPRMQDLPFDESRILTQEEAEIVRPYCCNDLQNTELLFNELRPEITLREEMSKDYGLELRSKSDAQIAEAVINSELQKLTGYFPKKPTINPALALQYNVPSFVKFESKKLNDILETIRATRFQLDKLGSPIMPDALEGLKVQIGKGLYSIGMGGLHSNEKSISHFASDEVIIADNDFDSFYPKIILNQNLFPSHLGEAFIKVYRKIVDTRLHAKEQAKICKKAGDREAAKRWKTIADSLKITINGSFGKFGNKYSTLYAPQLMLQVTITGQLVLLMLIEKLENVGIEVISGNTDGIISKYHKSRHDEVRAIIKEIETITNFTTEETRYLSVHSRDVNSYVAVKEEGDSEARFLDERLGMKTKGAFCERGSALNSVLSKNPETLICSDAVLMFLKNKTPVEKTIRECKDIRRFVAIKNVKGGGEKDGVYLGKVVRWYYPKNEVGFISYVLSGNKVPKTDGAKPLMDLPQELPQDIDYARYEKEAVDLLYDCGYFKQAETASLFF